MTMPACGATRHRATPPRSGPDPSTALARISPRTRAEWVPTGALRSPHGWLDRRCSSAVLLTISTSVSPAADLGFLLHKHPDRVHEKELSFGVAQVCYPEATADRCTAALIVDIDPVSLVRNRRGGPSGRSLAQYVNDRPYAASSILSVAVGTMFRTAMSGRSKERPDLAERAIPLTVGLPVVPSRGGERLLRALFRAARPRGEGNADPPRRALPETGARAATSMSR